MRGGIESGAIEAHYCYLVDGTQATKDILALAVAQKCSTVVIGRRSLTWLAKLIDTDPAEELVRNGKGFTIWVVE
jgi:K+-sensing histidine kinase KdpD